MAEMRARSRLLAECMLLLSCGEVQADREARGPDGSADASPHDLPDTSVETAPVAVARPETSVPAETSTT